jgi:hypothetical protein
MMPISILGFIALMTNLYTFTDINQQIALGSNYSFNLFGFSVPFTIGTEGILLLIVVVGIIGTVAGISVLGSGMTTFSQAIIYKSLFYYALWGILSALCVAVILSFPIIGLGFWLVLTVAYAVGVQEQIGTHPS